ncbi:hypothetical protein [Phyllobacterium sophorae]|uniref:hypothetical protein n=1 Tax=Phyllobacterium sophorae TaxID=1520277 RepID=UPI001FDFE205|nr:hypothetical protein [Phyllobacterium sophorae]
MVVVASHLRVKVRGVAIRTAFAAIALSQFAAADALHAQAEDASFTDFPFLVHCEAAGVDHAFYLSKIDPDGVAVYISPDRLAGTLTITGKAQLIGGEGSGNCAGKTLEQLRSTGQAYYLQR